MLDIRNSKDHTEKVSIEDTNIDFFGHMEKTASIAEGDLISPIDVLWESNE